MTQSMLVDAYGRPFDNIAPAFGGRAQFPGFRAEDLVKWDVELIPKDETSMSVLETYWAPAGLDPVHERPAEARRYWAIRDRLLVGGVILDSSDALHLAKHYGVTHVLSFDDAHSDEGKWSQPNRACAPFNLGQPCAPDLRGDQERYFLERTVRWVRDLPPDAVVYAHGRLGHMRGPCAAYLVLRVRHRLSREDAQRICGRGPACPDHPWGRPLAVNFLFHMDAAIKAVLDR